MLRYIADVEPLEREGAEVESLGREVRTADERLAAAGGPGLLSWGSAHDTPSSPFSLALGLRRKLHGEAGAGK